MIIDDNDPDPYAMWLSGLTKKRGFVKTNFSVNEIIDKMKE